MRHIYQEHALDNVRTGLLYLVECPPETTAGYVAGIKLLLATLADMDKKIKGE